MLFNTRLLVVGFTSFALVVGTNAQAGTQLFNASWMTKSFGNERDCGDVGCTGESAVYSVFGMPQGINCNPNQPRCDFDSTPTDGDGNFHPLGGSQQQALYCVPIAKFGETQRPAKYQTVTTGVKGRPIPPLYRNPAFFTVDGKASRYPCTATSTGKTPDGKGLVQAGNPIRNKAPVQAITVGGAGGGFSFPAAPATGNLGIRVTGEVGEFGAIYPYVYSYTYATMRNAKGVFGPGKGPGSFNVQYLAGKQVVASIDVKQGAAKFGGTMRMLGALHTKVCYYRNGGCSLGGANWLYDVIGTRAQTNGGVVTKGYQAFGSAVYFNSGLNQTSTVRIEGSRFPWTTGTITLTAVGRGPHKTVHYGMGYDNRYTTMTKNGATALKGTLQLVSPVMTRWLLPQGAFQWETGGIAILKLEFVPEPHTWLMLAAGVSLLGVGFRMRGR